MGNSKPAPPKKDPNDEIQEAILNMRMTSKQFEHAAKRAEKDQKKEMEKAKIALKKNNEDGARMFLQNAATKYREQQNMTKMSHRMEALVSVLQANTSNQQLMSTLKDLTPKLAQQQGMMDMGGMQKDLYNWQETMDKLAVAGKIMDNNLNQQSYDEGSDKGVEDMLAQLKQERILEVKNDLMTDPSMDFVNLNNPNQQNTNTQAVKKIG
jgi:charged multivesicular body protein 1